MTEHTIPSRRTVLKGAWAAPVVVLATAAPAFAASGEASVIVSIPPTMDRDDSPQDPVLPVTINFTNRNTGATGAVTISVRFIAPIGGLYSTAPTDVTPGWTSAGAGVGDSQFDRVFTFTSVAGVPGALTPTGTGFASLSFRVRTVSALSEGTITTTATAARGTIEPGAGAWT